MPKFNLGPVNIKVEGIFGTNLYDLLMLGGYAIKNIGEKGDVKLYICQNTFCLDRFTFGPKDLFGIFAGYTKESWN